MRRIRQRIRPDVPRRGVATAFRPVLLLGLLAIGASMLVTLAPDPTSGSTTAPAMAPPQPVTAAPAELVAPAHLRDVVPVEVARARRPSVRGRVIGAIDRQPVHRFRAILVAVGPDDEGARLQLEPTPDAVAFEAADGSFALTAAGQGRHLLQVWAERGLTARQWHVLPAEGDDIVTTVEIAPGVSLRGIVVDADGVPVGQAWVTLHPIPMAAGAATGTDGDGAFHLPPVPPGAYGIFVENRERPMLHRTDLWLHAGDPEPFVRLQLPRGAAVSGTVRPWRAGQQAEVIFAHAQGAIRRTRAAADGSYSLAGMTPGPYHVFVERGEATFRASVASQLGDRGAPIDVELVAGIGTRFDPIDPVATMARLRGRIDGHPAPDELLVQALQEDRPLPERARGLFRTIPDPHGAFVLDGLLPGRWRIAFLTHEQRIVHEAVLTFGPEDDREEAFRIAPQGR